jgi:hypothetical protein
MGTKRNWVCKEEIEIEHLLNKDTPKNTAEWEINDAKTHTLRRIRVKRYHAVRWNGWKAQGKE